MPGDEAPSGPRRGGGGAGLLLWSRTRAKRPSPRLRGGKQRVFNLRLRAQRTPPAVRVRGTHPPGPGHSRRRRSRGPLGPGRRPDCILARPGGTDRRSPFCKIISENILNLLKCIQTCAENSKSSDQLVFNTLMMIFQGFCGYKEQRNHLGTRVEIWSE